jgi:GT2 family glycosyltransferase
VSEKNLLIMAKRRAGRIKRWLKRKMWERNIGKQYQAWLAEAALATTGSVDNAIAIAVVVPVFNPPVSYLDECLSSVLNQSAQHWQLVVSDDGSTDAEVVKYLDEFTTRHAVDARVVVLRNANGGISTACNRGIAAVTTDYFGWLDHDDALDRRCFAEFSATIEGQSAAGNAVDIVYSDEDKIDTRGNHFELYAKPDFSPELLLTQMYLCHFTVFRKEIVEAIGGFRPEMDGAQDFDVALRLLPNLHNVVHIPKPLYHWRAWSGSTALTIDAKPWAQQSTARAQQEHLNRTFGDEMGVGGSALPSKVPGLNAVHPRVTTKHLVSVIIPTIGTPNQAATGRFVDDAVASLRAMESQAELEIIVVTTGDIAPVLGADKQVVYRTESFNFSEAINTGRSAATGDYLFLLNDDTTAFEPDPITRLLELGQIEGVGITGCKLSYPDGRLQHVGMVLLPSGPTHVWISKPAKEAGYFGSVLTPRNYSAVTAAAMLVRTNVFDELGGFDTAFAKDFNDVDFCLRARAAGYRVAWTPYAHFTHYEGATMARKKPDLAEQALFTERWAEACALDPYYSSALNPNLQRSYEAL